MKNITYIYLDNGSRIPRLSWKDREFQFKMIKSMMKESRSWYSELQKKTKEIKNELLHDVFHVESINELSGYERTQYNISLNSKLNSLYWQYDGENSYHLIYKDGSEEIVSDGEILATGKIPKLENVVYMQYSGPCDEQDTEIGEWYFISPEGTEEEFHRRDCYQDAIQKKFSTSWYQRIQRLSK